MDEAVVVGRLAGHRDHDGHAAIRRDGPSTRFGMRTEAVDVLLRDRPSVCGSVRLPLAAQRTVEDHQHRVDRGQHMRFRAPDRRQAALASRICSDLRSQLRSAM